MDYEFDQPTDATFVMTFMMHAKVTSRNGRFIFRVYVCVVIVCRDFVLNFHTVPTVQASSFIEATKSSYQKATTADAVRISNRATRKTISKTKHPKQQQQHQQQPIRTQHDYSSLVGELQRCFRPEEVLANVGSQVNPTIDPHGTISSLILVRLSKQLINQNNRFHQNNYLDSYNKKKTNYSNTNDNIKSYAVDFPITNATTDLWNNVLKQVINTLSKADWASSFKTLDSAVDGTKAAAVLSRLNPTLSQDIWKQLQFTWTRRSKVDISDINTTTDLVHQLEPHHLSGLKWSCDCFQLHQRDVEKESKDYKVWTLPPRIQQAYDELNLPFHIRPGYFSSHLLEEDVKEHFHVPGIVEQVQFQVDEIRTSSNRTVPERRQTAWQGDEHVSAFAYSGKSMKRMPWSPLVRMVRDRLHRQQQQDEISAKSTSKRTNPANPCYYDGCLLNLYPDGGSGMRYHIDPDQGILWDYPTAVVSVGASRRIAFRPIPPLTSAKTTPSLQDNEMTTITSVATKKGKKTKRRSNNLDQSILPASIGSIDDSRDKNQRVGFSVASTSSRNLPHTFALMHGDVTEMFDNCQSTYQHAVKTAEDKNETAPRVSLVFKKTLSP